MLASGQLSFSFGPADRPAPARRLSRPSILAAIRGRLLAIHGPQRNLDRSDPLDQLVSGILGARTREDIAFPTFKRLHYRYKSWQAVSLAPAGDIERIIRPVTHAEKKAEQLPQALRLIEARAGSLDLMFLQPWPVQRAMDWLMQLPGAGPRIAATTLNWSALRKRILPVDLHLARVARRLGLVPDGADYGRGCEMLMDLVPPEWTADELLEFQWLIRLHSQRVCAYDAPACFRCPLRDLCARGVTRH